MGFFSFNKPKFHIYEADRNWVEENYKWLIDIGNYPMADSIQYQFNKDNFPNTLQSDDFDPRHFLLDCCDLLNILPTQIALEYRTDVRDLENTPWIIEGKTTDSILLISQETYKIILANNLKTYPKSCIFNIVKQVLKFECI